MNRKTAYIVLAVSFIFFITTFVLYVTREDEKPLEKSSEEIKVEEKSSEEEAELPELLGVKLFRPVESGDLFKPVNAEIPPAENRIALYRSFFKRLMEPDDGTIIPVPAGITLRTIFTVEEDNLLVLDFSEELMKIFPSGTEAEREFIYYFVNNFCYNFPEIGGIRFLIDGDEKSTLNGHIDLAGTFTPRFEMLAGN